MYNMYINFPKGSARFLNGMIYLDNSSTTRPCKRAVDCINKALCDSWGNPSSLHTLGIETEAEMSAAREKVAEAIGARSDEIIFTGSGTEANNTALLSCLKAAKRGGRVITTAIEHPSVLETCKKLTDAGLEVIYLKPAHDGKVLPEDLKNALTDNTLLVSMMLVNNETGAVQPVTEAAALTKRISPRALFHCDAVQAFGKLPINVRQSGIDLLTASGHKIHGPKGIGFLFKRKTVNIPPLITGGGQENGMRSGTEPVPLIMGLKGAVEDLPNLNTQLEKQKQLWNYARETLMSRCGAVINSPDDALPYILNISLPGYRSETLLHFLEARNIFVSSGSACAKGHGSYVLKEMGLNPTLTDSALRISFCKDNTENDVNLLADALCAAEGSLRKAKI